MACGGGGDDYLQGFAKLSLKAKFTEIAKGKRGKNLAINEELYNKLYDYQKDGVRWLFDLFEKGKGGILGDDMGLGKTIQMIAFLSGMLDCKLIKAALIIAPMSVINVWINSFKEFSPRSNVATFHGEKRAREKALERIQDRGGILLTTYDLVGREGERLGRDAYGEDFEWDYVVADEGHQLKNKSIKRSQGAHSVPTKYRIILTGTPLQNRLPELWALFDWTHFGQLLGTVRTFNGNYGNYIEEGRKKCASAHARRLGNEFAESLRKIIEPYLLRRTKDEVGLSTRPNSTVSQRPTSTTSDGAVSPTAMPRQMMPSLPRRNDFVVWLTLSKEQEDIYRRFLTTPEVKMLLDPSVKTSPLTQLIVLKKLCDHPRLLSENACQTLGITFDRNLGEAQVEQNAMGTAPARVPSAQNVDQELDDLSVCIGQSIKTAFLKALLPQLVNEGHKVLVFSMSLRMLNLVAQILKNRLGIKFLRLDGQITKLEERQRIIEKFQTSDRYKVLLLTTQVGGVGLTLTAADRAIIIDPAWNPAVDSQAVDRIYRVGQKRNVVIYRLITAGTVEEKIYRRQVFKVSIFKQVAHSSNAVLSTAKDDDPMRYFTQQDLRELFKLSETKSSDTQKQLDTMHGHQRVSDEALDEHINFVTGLPGIVGISDHDLLFTKADDPTEVENVEEEARAKQMVQRAKALIEEESRNPNSGSAAEGLPRHRDPLSERQPGQSSAPPSEPPLYPRGFGQEKGKIAPKIDDQFVRSQYDEPLMQLSSDLPLYLQRKGLIKPGQTVLTPPKLIGRGQKEKSFTLHRSYSDAELNSAVGGIDDDVILVEDNENADDGDGNDETISLDESMIRQSNRNRKVNRVEDDSMDSMEVDQPVQPQEEVNRDGNSQSSHSSQSQNERPTSSRQSEQLTRQVEVINLDSDEDDVQFVDPPTSVSTKSRESSVRPVSNADSSRRDSIIKSGWKGRNRKVIEDEDDGDSEDPQPPVAPEISPSTTAETASPPADVIVIDEGPAPLPRLSDSSRRDSIVKIGLKGRNRKVIEEDDDDVQPLSAAPKKSHETNASPPPDLIVTDEDPVSNADSSRHDSVIKSGWRGRNRKVIEDDDSEEHSPQHDENQAPPSGSADSAVVVQKFPQNSGLNASDINYSGGTPSFTHPLISSTPFVNTGNGPSLKQGTEPGRLRSFPSVIPISPLISKSSRITESGPLLASNKGPLMHGTKRSNHERSIEVLDSDNSRNQSTNIIANSVVLSDNDSAEEEEVDGDKTDSTDSMIAPTDPGQDGGEPQVVDETGEETESYEEEEEEEEAVDDEDSNFYKTATSNRTDTYNESESDSHIFLAKSGADGDASFAY